MLKKIMMISAFLVILTGVASLFYFKIIDLRSRQTVWDTAESHEKEDYLEGALDEYHVLYERDHLDTMALFKLWQLNARLDIKLGDSYGHYGRAAFEYFNVLDSVLVDPSWVYLERFRLEPSFFKAAAYLVNGGDRTPDVVSDLIASAMQEDYKKSQFSYVENSSFLKATNRDVQLELQGVELFSKEVGKDLSFDHVYALTRYRASLKKHISDFYGALGEHERILELLKLKGDSTSIYVGQANFEIGMLYHALQKENEALRYYQRALKIKNSSAALHNVGLIESESDPIKAIQTFTQAINLENGSEKVSGSYLSRGIAYLKINDTSSACRDFSKANELGEDDAFRFIEKHCR